MALHMRALDVARGESRMEVGHRPEDMRASNTAPHAHTHTHAHSVQKNACTHVPRHICIYIYIYVHHTKTYSTTCVFTYLHTQTDRFLVDRLI